MTVTPADLALYLGSEVDTARATFLIARATDLCTSVTSPLPPGSDAVVLDVTARAWMNPGNVTSEGMGPFNATFGAGAGGLWLTRQNKVSLRRLAGRGSAFAIDPTPAAAATAIQGLPFWDFDPVAWRAANPTADGA